LVAVTTSSETSVGARGGSGGSGGAGAAARSGRIRTVRASTIRKVHGAPASRRASASLRV
jgi:hypothetical protein